MGISFAAAVAGSSTSSNAGPCAVPAIDVQAEQGCSRLVANAAMFSSSAAPAAAESSMQVRWRCTACRHSLLDKLIHTLDARVDLGECCSRASLRPS